jgi:predicted PurR-regulated permease PerM
MTNKKLSRRRVIATLFGLTLFSILVVGSGTQVVTIARITSQVATVIELLELVDETSGSILASVDNAYQDLGSYLKDNNFTTDVVQSMEGQYAELDARFSELTSNLNKAESEANTLFTLLKSRADENTTPELKQTMMSRISEKEDSFNLKIDDANQVGSSGSGVKIV